MKKTGNKSQSTTSTTPATAPAKPRRNKTRPLAIVDPVINPEAFAAHAEQIVETAEMFPAADVAPSANPLPRVLALADAIEEVKSKGRALWVASTHPTAEEAAERCRSSEFPMSTSPGDAGALVAVRDDAMYRFVVAVAMTDAEKRKHDRSVNTTSDQKINGHRPTALVRWMGAHDFTTSQADAVLRVLGVVMRRAIITIELNRGASKPEALDDLTVAAINAAAGR